MIANPSPVHRASTVKRARRTKAQIEQLDAQIVADLAADHPQSVRHEFYKMTDPRLSEPVPKTDKGAGNGYRAVQDRCLKLRRSGTIPYDWIADTSRVGYFINTYSSGADFLTHVASTYRAELWGREEVATYCEVWVESRSLAGVLLPICQELAVPLYPAGGFSSASFAWEAAQGLNRKGVTKVYYAGDHDPAGVLIDVSIERELRRHLKPGVHLDFERIAVTPEQIAAYDLPTKPRKEKDKRALHIERTVEAEAMPANIMRGLLRERIEALLPDGLLASVQLAEESERAILRAFADEVQEHEEGGDVRASEA